MKKIKTLSVGSLLLVCIVLFKLNFVNSPIKNSNVDIHTSSDIEIYTNENTNFKIIDDLDFFNKCNDSYIYFGRPTCPDCNSVSPLIDNLININNIEMYYFNTDYWRDNEIFKNIIKDYEIQHVPYIIYVKDNKPYKKLEFNEGVDFSNNNILEEKIKAFFNEVK